MKVVSRFESRLLRLLRAFLHGEPIEQMRPLVVEPCEAPPCLSLSAVALVQDTLAKGCVHLLARRDGWRRERHLRDGKLVEGRLWERTPPLELGLKFSRHTLGFLIWITAVDLEGKLLWEPPESELTIGDRLLLYFAFDALMPLRVASQLARSPAFHRNGLCWLAYPEQFASTPVDGELDFTPWTTGQGACILEALQRPLSDRWLAVEDSKSEIENWQRMQAVGRGQERVLASFLAAVEQTGRTDLARFLLETAAGLLKEGIEAKEWIGTLTSAGPRLADRSDTYRAALAFLHRLPRLREWTAQARGVGYFDEGYPASQLWLADWERCQGEVCCSRAAAVIRQLDPMKQATPVVPPGTS
jgi:hypothetical protein